MWVNSNSNTNSQNLYPRSGIGSVESGISECVEMTQFNSISRFCFAFIAYCCIWTFQHDNKQVLFYCLISFGYSQEYPSLLSLFFHRENNLCPCMTPTQMCTASEMLCRNIRNVIILLYILYYYIIIHILYYHIIIYNVMYEILTWYKKIEKFGSFSAMVSESCGWRYRAQEKQQMHYASFGKELFTWSIEYRLIQNRIRVAFQKWEVFEWMSF